MPALSFHAGINATAHPNISVATVTATVSHPQIAVPTHFPNVTIPKAVRPVAELVAEYLSKAKDRTIPSNIPQVTSLVGDYLDTVPTVTVSHLGPLGVKSVLPREQTSSVSTTDDFFANAAHTALFGPGPVIPKSINHRGQTDDNGTPSLNPTTSQPELPAVISTMLTSGKPTGTQVPTTQVGRVDPSVLKSLYSDAFPSATGEPDPKILGQIEESMEEHLLHGPDP